MICRICQWLISRSLDGGRPLSGRVRRHINSCAACRRFLAFSRKLEGGLRREAAGPDAVPVSLHSDLMSSIRAVKHPDAPPVKRFPPLAAAALLVVILVAGILVGVALPRNELVKREPGIAKQQELMETRGAFLLQVAEIEEQVTQLDETIAVQAEDPYQEELKNLKADLKSATDFLLAGAEM